jgi:hypothetical protein
MDGKLTTVVSAWQVMDDEELFKALEQLADDMENLGRVSKGGMWKSPPNDNRQIEQLFSEGASEFLDELKGHLSDLEDLNAQVEELRNDLRDFLTANEETLEEVERTLDPEEEDETEEPAISH